MGTRLVQCCNECISQFLSTALAFELAKDLLPIMAYQTWEDEGCCDIRSSSAHY